jgi:hypothetical protein
MRFEGTFKITKRSPGAITVKIGGIGELFGYSRMGFLVLDPDSLEDTGKIVIEIPEKKIMADSPPLAASGQKGANSRAPSATKPREDGSKVNGKRARKTH